MSVAGIFEETGLHLVAVSSAVGAAMPASVPFSGGAGFQAVLSTSPFGLCTSPPFVLVLLPVQLRAAVDQGTELGYK